jgi:hypothetical protein
MICVGEFVKLGFVLGYAGLMASVSVASVVIDFGLEVPPRLFYFFLLLSSLRG